MSRPSSSAPRATRPSGVYNGHPAAGIGFSLAADANAIDTADAVRAAIERQRGTLPANVEVEYPYDTTPFVRLSIERSS